MIRKISKKDFKKRVIDHSGLSLVQFIIQWNGACQIILPIYEELAISYKDHVAFFIVDVEKETGLNDQFGIMDLPTILFFKDGSVVDHIIGLTPKNIMISKIENALSRRLN